MNRIFTFVTFLFLFLRGVTGQPATDHWETVFYADTLFRYATSNDGEPPAGWREPSFDDHTWAEGHGGIGYGDNDDRTVIAKCNALYYRTTFVIHDTSVITAAALDIDYDDAFVAYLNGTEIARSPGLSSPYPAWDEISTYNHEAHMYSGGRPEQFFVDKEKLRATMNNGINVLAVEIHNSSPTSSDMSSLTWFSAGISVSDRSYLPVPSWFTEPWFYQGSTLPVIKINTYGQAIPDEPKIDAWMEIIDNGPGKFNSIHDSGNVYTGHIGIEIRGASSSHYPQKPYSLETRDSLGDNLNVPLFGMPAENDWLLISHYNEKTFMRNPLSFNMFREMGHYSVRFRLVDVMINDQYEGIYLFCEKVKRDKHRVDIKKLTPDDSSGVDITGGYIFKTDYAHSYDSWLSAYSPIDHPDYDTRFVYYYPKYYKITERQKAYLQEYVDNFQALLHQPDFADHYRDYIDLGSFLDYFIVSEVSRNIDGYKKSRYYHKNRDDKDNRLHAGPVWDFDWAWKNIHDCSFLANDYGAGWAYKTNDCRVTYTPGWYVRLMQDPSFADDLNCRYFQLRQEILSLDHLYAFMDTIYEVVKGPQENHYKRWPILGTRTGAPELEEPAQTYDEEVQRLKEWIRIRLEWLDENMPGSHDDCLSARKKIRTGTSRLHLFPNPATTHFYVESSGIIQTIEIFDVSGRKVRSENSLNRYSVRIDSRSLKKGIYFVRVSYVRGVSEMRKIVIR